MIFLTVGEQLTFDRLVQAVDDWARDEQVEVVAQIGPTKLVPCYLQHQPSFPQKEYRCLFERADCVVAHAGMGTIITAVELNKPLLVMPRLQAFNEHRTDHQLATAQRFSRLPIVTVAWDESELIGHLKNLPMLVRGVQSFLDQGPDSRLIEVISTFVNAPS